MGQANRRYDRIVVIRIMRRCALQLKQEVSVGNEQLAEVCAERESLRANVLTLRSDVAKCASGFAEFQVQFSAKLRHLQSAYEAEATRVRWAPSGSVCVGACESCGAVLCADVCDHHGGGGGPLRGGQLEPSHQGQCAAASV